MKGKQSGYWRGATKVGVFLVLLFVVCFIWYYIQPAGRELHEALFNVSYLGWSGMNVTSFILGAVQTFIWGYLFVALWYLAGSVSKSE